jgi:hypothetical protein
MAAVTKLALQQANTALANDNAALRAALSVAQADIERLRASRAAVEEKIIDMMEVASAVNRMPARNASNAVVTRYVDRMGRTFEKTRIGNMATTKEVHA